MMVELRCCDARKRRDVVRKIYKVKENTKEKTKINTNENAKAWYKKRKKHDTRKYKGKQKWKGKRKGIMHGYGNGKCVAKEY